MLILITPERPSGDYLVACNRLFAEGLQSLHLRMPGATKAEYEWAIQHIRPEYRHRLVICDYFELVELAGLGGVHLSEARRGEWQAHIGKGRLSISAHSVADLQSLPFAPSYALLSPIFESISKLGYDADYTLREQGEALRALPFPVVALGGIMPDNMAEVRSWGFAGGAVLGYMNAAWTRGEGIGQGEAELLRALAKFDKPTALTLGGHDPSSGAGITADVLTFEAEGVYPLSICTTLTAQHEARFERLLPLPQGYLEEALRLLLSKHQPTAIKIGLTASWSDVELICRLCRERGVKHIVWDPVIGATAGRGLIHEPCSKDLLDKLLAYCRLITPNIPEAEFLFGTSEVIELQKIARHHGCAILLKGGHSSEIEGREGIDTYLVQDRLILPSGAVHTLLAPRLGADKHGTGCRLSAGITARLAEGYDLVGACRLGHQAVQSFLRSGQGLLAQSIVPHKAQATRALADYPLQYITNGRDKAEILHRAEQALLGGVRWIQLRMKEASQAERLSVALALKAIMQAYPEAILIIDDDVEVAVAADAEGVHLGLQDMPIAEARAILGKGKIIGGTCNRPEDIALRATEGADYVGCGPWRMTTTKKRLSPLLGAEGMARLIAYNKALPQPLPLYAIGGIDIEDIEELIQLGVHGIALSGLIERSEDIRLGSAAIIQRIRKAQSGFNPLAEGQSHERSQALYPKTTTQNN